MRENSHYFDNIIDRLHTGAEKWDEIIERDGYRKENWIVPFTTADMELTTCPAVVRALKERAGQGIYGYTKADHTFYKAIIQWISKRHGQTVGQEEIVCCVSAVTAIMMAIRSMSGEGEGVLFLAPAYTGFYKAAENTGRCAVEIPMVLQEDEWTIDYELLEKEAEKKENTLFLLCNPQNPCGRVLSEQELRRIAEICMENDIFVIADEIHGDIILRGRHVMYRSLSDECRKNSITLMSPSKTFNLAGLMTAYALIEREDIRERFDKELSKAGHADSISAFGYTALIAAYTAGEDWLNQVTAYIGENERILDRGLEMISLLKKPSVIEGTYLAWLDIRQSKISQDELLARLRQSGIYLTDGRYFGRQGEGYVRMNLAVPGCEIEKMLERIEAIDNKEQD